MVVHGSHDSHLPQRFGGGGMATAESKTFPYVLLPPMAVRQLFGAYQPPAHVKLSSSSAPGRFSCSAPSPQTVSIPHGDAARQRRYLATSARRSKVPFLRHPFKALFGEILNSRRRDPGLPVIARECPLREARLKLLSRVE